MSSLTMPNEEAIKVLKGLMSEPISEAELYCAETCYGSGDLVFPEMEDYAYNTAIIALEKAEKYKWHDLRKNPDDLPKKYENILVMTNRGCVSRTYRDENGFKNGTASAFCYYLDRSVLAWKYIEPFEGEEE